MYDVVFFPLWCFTCCDKNHALTLVYTYSTPALRTTKMFGLFLRLTLGFLSHFSFLSVFCIKIAPTHVTCLIIYVTWLRSFFCSFLSLSLSLCLLCLTCEFCLNIYCQFCFRVCLPWLPRLSVTFTTFFLHGPNYVTRLPTCLNTYIEFPFGRTSHVRAVSSSRQSLRRGFLVDLKEVSGFRCECVCACWWFTAVVTFHFVIFIVLYICFKLKKVATFA